jgi:hypothetical protein
MSVLRTAPAPSAASMRPMWNRILGRWFVSFLGFPLGGLAAMAAMILTGPVDSLGPALGGGLLTGAVLGAVQAWALGDARPRPAAWVAATAVGLMAGLGLGAWLVDYQTDIGSLVVQGLVSGALVGAAQAFVLWARIGSVALLWPVALSGIWAAGWAVTTSAGIRVDEQFTVFGSSGALLVTLLTAVLPVLLTRAHRVERSAS